MLVQPQTKVIYVLIPQGLRPNAYMLKTRKSSKSITVVPESCHYTSQFGYKPIDLVDTCTVVPYLTQINFAQSSLMETQLLRIWQFFSNKFIFS